MEAKPSDREVVAGPVERVTYQNTDNGFCIVGSGARPSRDLVTLVGHAATISAGEWITAAGGWVNDRTHGQQFKAQFLKRPARSKASGGCALCCSVAMLFLPSRNGGHNVLGNRLLVLGRTEES